MPTAPISDLEAVEYIKSLYDLEQDPACLKAAVNLGPWSAFVMIGALQLATRHPEMSETQRELIQSIIDQLRPLFTGTDGEQLLQLGNDPAYDIDRACRHPFGPHAASCPPGEHVR
jgi:hypothetical protein